MSEPIELLFFDTFAHESTEELNLDLVQFPKPVYVTEIRIIPLGARVQADFPGGVRLGATNPGQFKIEFFVNDLGKPGASTFETLGGFEYNQNGCISLACPEVEAVRKIPTDGLVLRGWYTTITLAVYGKLTNNLTEQIVQPVPNPALPAPPNTIADAQQVGAVQGPEWPPEGAPPTPYQAGYPPAEPFPPNSEYGEYYEAPKDPRAYHHPAEGDWEAAKGRNRVEGERERDEGRRERDKAYRAHSRDGERYSRERDWEHDRWRERDRNRQHEDYRRTYERDDRKRPRTPPMQSPKRPHTPHSETTPPESTDSVKKGDERKSPLKDPPNAGQETATPPIHEDSLPQPDIDDFEPILSDEEIVDEDMDYDYAAYTNNDDLIKQFIPGVTQLKKFTPKPLFTVEANLLQIDEKLKLTIGIVDDYFKSSIEKYTNETFKDLKTEMKEEFIHLCEKLINIFDSLEHFSEIIKLYFKLQTIDALNADDQELKVQVDTIIETVLDWLKISVDYHLANLQDSVCKIRHIKCGVRLVEWCCNSNDFVKLLIERKLKIHKVLLELYDQEYMALSIKLMIVKALDTYLLHKVTIELFLNDNCPEGAQANGYHAAADKSNGYRILVDKVRQDPLVRLKFALNSILKKLNIYEVFLKLHQILAVCRKESKLGEEHVMFVTYAFEQILDAFQNGQFVLSQPKRFLPVTAQFEISRSECRNVLVEYFRMFNALECFLLLLSLDGSYNLPSVKTPIFEILAKLLQTEQGLDYLLENVETVNGLIRYLLRNEEELQFTVQNCIEIKSHNLGLEMAYKLEALNSVYSLQELGLKTNKDYDNLDVIDQLHALFCLTFSHIGKKSVAEVLGMKDNVSALFQFLSELNIKEKSDYQVTKFKKSAGIAYILDLIVFTITTIQNVPFLQNNLKQLMQIVDQAEMFEETARINELKAYLQPLESATLNYNNVSHLVEVLDKELEGITNLPGQAITSLRILHHLGISPHLDQEIIEKPLSHYIELKYKHLILQLYSLDGTTILTKILQKINEHYEQPSLHTPTFASNTGFCIINLLDPCVDLLKQLLTYVIQCRNTSFKDLTAIPTLLQTFNLFNSYPSTCAVYLDAQKICKTIIETLLVYTQPISDEIHEKDSINKTVWSLMIGEVIKYVTYAPFTFVSGLLIFSELLPLPLPIQTSSELTKDEVAWAGNLRKLWAAHLHPFNSSIQELISRLCTTTHPQLLNLLRRVCVQLADLAANSALVVARGTLEIVTKSFADLKPVCSGHQARVLNFFACLVTHSTLKCAVLSLHDKINLSPIFESVLKASSTCASHVQAQECVLSIIQSFCDVEVTLYQNSAEISSDSYLANALPGKEQLLVVVGLVLDFLQVENSFVCYLPALRVLLLLTEHDYGFYHLKEQVLKRGDLFSVVLNKLAKNFAKDSPEAECFSSLSTLMEFLSVCKGTEEVEAGLLYTARKITLNGKELRSLVGWSDDKQEDEKHSLVVLEEVLKKLTEEDATFGSLHEGILTVLAFLRCETKEEEEGAELEPILPEAESLLVQFSARLIYAIGEVCDERLTIRYWLAPSDDTENESVPCDLAEITRLYLPQEFAIVREIEKLCRICPLDKDEKEKRESDQKSKLKKPFVTPMRSRGFPRTIQQRSDLFRSRPPNTSRPPSLHVDDFVALETCGAQPTGPTGYNKFSRELLASSRIHRGGRGRSFVTTERSVHSRHMTWWGAGLSRGPYQ